MPALPYPDPALSDDVVALRPWRAADIHQRFVEFANPECLRFSWPFTEPFTEAHVVAHFHAEEQARLRGVEINLGVVDPADSNVVLGGTSLYNVDIDKATAAVGYWLSPEVRGRGIATRTVRLLARWAFDHLCIVRLELTCAPDNMASRRVAERCRFTQEGVLRSHLPFKDGRRDTMMFSLLPDELA